MDAASQFSTGHFHPAESLLSIQWRGWSGQRQIHCLVELESCLRRRAMKRRIALGAVVAAVAMMSSMDSAKADHCRSSSRSYGFSSGSFYRPSYSYGHSQSYYRPSYSYGHSSFYRPSYGHSYSRPGFSITFGSGRSGFSFGRSYGRSSHYGHRH